MFIMFPLGCFLKILVKVFLLLLLPNISWRLLWHSVGHR